MAAAKGDRKAYRNQAAQRVLTVLDAFADRIDPVTPAELGEALAMSKNMVHRALVLLESEGLIVRTPSGRTYQLGPRILTFASGQDDESDDVNAISRPYLEALAELTGESVFFGIIVGGNRVIIDKLEASGRRVAHSQRGLAVPLHVSKTSRVLFAYLSNAEIASYLKNARPLREYADLFQAAETETIEDVYADIETIRRQGYIAWRNPYQYGAAYIAFPVLDSENRPQAVISIGAPSERMDQGRIEALLPEVLRIAAQLNSRSRLLPPLPMLSAYEGAR